MRVYLWSTCDVIANYKKRASFSINFSSQSAPVPCCLLCVLFSTMLSIAMYLYQLTQYTTLLLSYISCSVKAMTSANRCATCYISHVTLRHQFYGNVQLCLLAASTCPHQHWEDMTMSVRLDACIWRWKTAAFLDPFTSDAEMFSY